MEWKVINALSTDVERQHLNKILAEIRAAVTAAEIAANRPSDNIQDVVGTMVENNIERGITVTYDGVKQVLDFDVNDFTIRLSGDVEGSAQVTDLGSVNIITSLSEDAQGIEEAPNDDHQYWRGQEQWNAVPNNTINFANTFGTGFVAQISDPDQGSDVDTIYVIREFEAQAGELVVENPTGEAGNVSYGLAEVTNTGVGVAPVKIYTRDEFGRIEGDEDADTDDLPEGVVNLYFTDERAQDAVGTILVDTADIELDYSDATPSISAVLTAAIHDSLDLADTALQPGDNISELVNDVGFLESVVAGTNVTIDNTDPLNPIINATGGGGVTDFTDLGDVPSSYVGAAGQVVAVNATEDGLEFVASGGVGTVTSVDIDDATGITFTGGPITTSGSITPALSANLQAWHALATSAKEDAFSKGDLIQGANVTLTGTLTGRLVGSGNVTIAAAAVGGQVDSVVGGTGIDVDATDPENPEVNLDAATIASLALADSATQPGDLATVATTGDYNDLINQPTLLTDGDKGDITVGSGVTTLTIDNNAVTDAKLRDSAALSVIGRSANSTGDPADIAAGTDGHVLRRSGTTLGFGQIVAAGITNNTIGNGKFSTVASGTIKGRATAGTGNVEDLTLTQVLDTVGSAAQGDILYRGAATWTRLPAGSSGQFLKTQGAGANPIWDAAGGGGGTVDTITAADFTVVVDSSDPANPTIRFAHIPTNTLLGRNDPGTGIVEALTPAEARTMLNVADGAQPGTVTSVGVNTTGPLIISGSPVTTAGTITVNFDTTSARRALMSAGFGVQPTFRAIEYLDLPAEIASGTYTPTISNITNVAASTSHGAQWLRVGSTVTVSGSVNIDPTAAGATVIRISLPIASNFANTHECAGNICSTTGETGPVFANITFNIAQCQFIATDTSNHPFYYQFTYTII